MTMAFLVEGTGLLGGEKETGAVMVDIDDKSSRCMGIRSRGPGSDTAGCGA
jgi:hypothetical protein